MSRATPQSITLRWFRLSVLRQHGWGELRIRDAFKRALPGHWRSYPQLEVGASDWDNATTKIDCEADTAVITMVDRVTGIWAECIEELALLLPADANGVPLASDQEVIAPAMLKSAVCISAAFDKVDHRRCHQLPRRAREPVGSCGGKAARGMDEGWKRRLAAGAKPDRLEPHQNHCSRAGFVADQIDPQIDDDRGGFFSGLFWPAKPAVSHRHFVPILLIVAL